jgi:hypothetical protein
VQATEDTAAPINITLALEDNDSSESINSIIMTVPDTVTLSAGTNNNDGTWTLTQSQVSGLQVIPNADSLPHKLQCPI